MVVLIMVLSGMPPGIPEFVQSITLDAGIGEIICAESVFAITANRKIVVFFMGQSVFTIHQALPQLVPYFTVIPNGEE
jgi:uncharacterized membrane protein (Fun14 family)